jgi:hypothetical protein
METECPLCGTGTAKFQAGDPRFVSCPICGKFGLDFRLQVDRDMQGERHPYLSAATRKASESGRLLILDLSNWKTIEEEQRTIRISEKLTLLLRLIGDRSGSPGGEWKIESYCDYPLVAAQNPAELGAYLEYLARRGLIEERARRNDGTLYALTIPGWQEIEPIPPIGGVPGRCFVAMSFDVSLDAAYVRGIKPAIIDCGFEPVCMKEIATNEGITDRILSEIRLAQFVVADFTGQRGGVYFEAGFARGLGRKVIWARRTDELHLVHFDIKHFGHVVWDDPADLRTKLSQSILANIIPNR